MLYRKALWYLLLFVIVILASCGSQLVGLRELLGEPAIISANPAPASLEEAIAELDSLEAPAGTDLAVFNQLKDALRAALQARTPSKLASAPPTGAANAIPDLLITDSGNGTFNYSWHYYNVGDYNQDGIVGIADVTPLAVRFGQTHPLSEVNTLPAVVDGGSSGRVDIADVTPIAVNFGDQVFSYRLEAASSEDGTYSEVQIILLSAGLDKDIARMRFSVDLAPQPGYWYRLVPLDAGGEGGQSSVPFQAPSAATVWAHSWGNDNSDHANDVATDSDGNTIVVGSYDDSSFTDTEAVILKYTPAGALQWAKTWGGSEDDVAYGVAVDSEGNAYVTGETRSFASVFIAFILKYAPDGTLLWQKTWGSTNRCCGNAIALDGTGQVYVAGYELGLGGGESLLLLKYHTDGSYLDMKALSASNLNAYALAVSGTGDVYVAGRTKDTTSTQDDMLIVKYSSGGLLQWQKQWGNDPGTDIASGICTDSSGNVFVAGRAFSGDMGQGGYDAVLMKLDSGGTLIWQETWGGPTHDEVYGLVNDSGGNLYITGHTYSFGTGLIEGMAVKFSSGGARLWAKVWGSGDQDDRFRAIALYPDGRLAIAGWKPAAGGSWSDASAGVTEAQTVPLLDATGTEVAPVGADSVPAGNESEPSGIQDTGGGGDDIIVVQADQSGW